MNKLKKPQRAFSLIELIVTTVILAVLAAAALPATQTFVDNSQRRAIVNDILGFLSMGREKSVLTGTILTLCPLTASGSCGKDWTKPLTLFKDPGNKRELSSRDQVVQVMMPPKRGFLKTASLHKSFFQYRPDGKILSDLGNITWCPDDKNPKKAVHFIIRKGGTIRVAKDTDGDGIPDKANGKPLQC